MSNREAAAASSPMTTDTPAAARALILLFRENAIPMSDRNSFLYTILEDALSAPVAAQPAASGVDALWVERAMKRADDYAIKHALHVQGRGSFTPAADAREALRAHLSTALTGAAKETK